MAWRIGTQRPGAQVRFDNFVLFAKQSAPLREQRTQPLPPLHQGAGGADDICPRLAIWLQSINKLLQVVSWQNEPTHRARLPRLLFGTLIDPAHGASLSFTPPLKRKGLRHYTGDLVARQPIKGGEYHTSARCRFEACSAREAMFDTACSLLRVASTIAFEALLAKSSAAF